VNVCKIARRLGWQFHRVTQHQVNFAGGRPAASHFLLLRQNKVTKEKATPVCRPCGVPCVARLPRRLRNSRCALRQSSPTSPDQPALLGGAQGRVSENPKQKTVNSGGQQVAHHTEVDRQYNLNPVHLITQTNYVYARHKRIQSRFG